MRVVHLANTDFEFELAQLEDAPIERIWMRYLLCLQLQFIPLLYAQEGEAIAVTAFPDQTFIHQLLELGLWRAEELPTFVPIDGPLPSKFELCRSWGFSKRVQKWAQDRKIAYPMPEWSIVQEVNSKAFSFKQGGHSPIAALIWNKRELEEWLHRSQGKRVLKTCFGLSGRGNFLIDENTSFDKICQFCEAEWKLHRPLIAEPWLDRFFDFSTQWEIDQNQNINLVGTTVFETTPQGIYRGTLAGPESDLFSIYQPFLEKHKADAYRVLEQIAFKGFFGPLGIDAFLYRNAYQEASLYPIVEINGRQTMSLAALRFQKRWFPNRLVRLTFAKVDEEQASLLPKQIQGKEKTILFPKGLVLDLIQKK